MSDLAKILAAYDSASRDEKKAMRKATSAGSSADVNVKKVADAYFNKVVQEDNKKVGTNDILEDLAFTAGPVYCDKCSKHVSIISKCEKTGGYHDYLM